MRKGLFSHRGSQTPSLGALCHKQQWAIRADAVYRPYLKSAVCEKHLGTDYRLLEWGKIANLPTCFFVHV